MQALIAQSGVLRVCRWHRHAQWPALGQYGWQSVAQGADERVHRLVRVGRIRKHVCNTGRQPLYGRGFRTCLGNSHGVIDLGHGGAPSEWRANNDCISCELEVRERTEMCEFWGQLGRISYLATILPHLGAN